MVASVQRDFSTLPRANKNPQKAAGANYLVKQASAHQHRSDPCLEAGCVQRQSVPAA